MKDDLKYVMSLEDKFDETCLILDIQQEFFKTQFESAISESHIHVYEKEIFEQNSLLESENSCLKKTITELSKQATDVKDEMTKQYEASEIEICCIGIAAFEIRSVRIWLCDVELLLRDTKSETIFNIEICQLALNKKNQNVFDILKAK
ncbi:hypothetical protein Tco_0271089 [Tanacetum coccineum]